MRRLVWVWLVVMGFLAVPALRAGSDAAPVGGGIPGAAAPVASLPLAVHAGSVVAVSRLADGVPWVDLDRALAQGLTAGGTGGPDLVVQRQPASGRVYALVALDLKPQRSVSRYDYRLECAGAASACLALGVGDGPFDARRWRVAGPGALRLLFEVPAAALAVDLVPALEVALPLRAWRAISLGATPAAAAEGGVQDDAPAASAGTAVEAAATAAPPAGGAAAPPKAKPKASPKASPKEPPAPRPAAPAKEGPAAKPDEKPAAAPAPPQPPPAKDALLF